MFQKSTILPRFIAGLVMLLPAWTLCAQTEPAKTQTDVIALTKERPVDKTMTTGDKHALQVSLEAGQYLRVVIEQTGINIIVAVFDPGGAQVVEVDSPAGAYGPEYISFVAEKQGNYLLQLRTTLGRSNTGRYSASIETLRTATPEDKESAAAEKAFTQGRQLLEQSSNRTEPDPKKRREEALGKFEQARVYWARKKSARWEALALHSLGITQRNLGHPSEAAKYFNEALDLSAGFEPRDWRLTAILLNDRGLNYTDLGEYSQAVESLTRALKMFQEKQDRRGEGSALINTVIALYSSNRFREGLSYLDRARQLRVEENDRVGEANVLQMIASGYDNLGEPHHALEYFDKSINVFKSMNETDKARSEVVYAGVLNNRALVYHTLGEWKSVIDSYEQAYKIFQRLDPVKAVRTRNNIGKAYYDLGDYSRAVAELDGALADSKKIKNPTTTAEVLINLGEVKASQGDTSAALTYFMNARDVGPTDRVRAGVLTNIGRMNVLQGNPRAAVDSYNEALKLYQKIESVEGETVALQRRGEAYRALGEKSAAVEDFKQALRLANSIATPQGKIEALDALARVERDLNELNTAAAHSKEALELIESQRTQVPGQQLRTSYFSTHVGHYELFIDLMMRQYRTTQSDSYLAAALEASERARARDLVDLLREANVDRSQVDSSLLEEELRIQQTLNAKAAAQMRLLSGKHTQEQAKTIEKDIADLLDQNDKLKTRIRASNPSYAKLTQTPPLAVGELQQLLDDETLLLEFFLGEERSYLWLVSRTSVTAVDSLPKRSEIEASGKAFYNALTEDRGVNTVSGSRSQRKDAAHSVKSDPVALSQMLLGSVADKLGKKRLVIVGDGMLQYLPFTALPVPNGSAQKTAMRSANPPYLIEEHEIVYLPSASVLAAVRTETAGRKPASLSVAVFADPVFDANDERVKAATQRGGVTVDTSAQKASTPNAGEARFRSGLELVPLPATEREARAIHDAIPPPGRTEIATGFEASRARVMRVQREGFQIVHFATHGDLNAEHPELSGIVLSLVDSNGQPVDGFLRLHDIYNLKLPADLIVLSACSTGLGQIIKGEGLIGLTRGFMHAGSPRIVASLWRVEDLGTLEIMKRFYQHMAREGMAPPAALRQAQVEMLRSKRWNSPYDWAAFVLQGEWKAIR